MFTDADSMCATDDLYMGGKRTLALNRTMQVEDKPYIEKHADFSGSILSKMPCKVKHGRFAISHFRSRVEQCASYMSLLSSHILCAIVMRSFSQFLRKKYAFFAYFHPFIERLKSKKRTQEEELNLKLRSGQLNNRAQQKRTELDMLRRQKSEVRLFFC